MEKVKIESKFADKNGKLMIVELSGFVDQSNSFQLQKMLDDIIDSGVFKIVVDFSALSYMSSAGWGIFVGEVKRFRENGGDIKLAGMTPEINDVFQMLEFFHILDDFPLVDEAVEAFDGGDDIMDLDNVEEAKVQPIKLEEVEGESEEIELGDEEPDGDTIVMEREAEVIELRPSNKIERKIPETGNDFNAMPVMTDINLTELPLAEKIKKLIQENPLVSSWQIKKILNHEHFGNTSIGVFKLYRLLRSLDLNSKEKRYRYYRSC